MESNKQSSNGSSVHSATEGKKPILVNSVQALAAESTAVLTPEAIQRYFRPPSSDGKVVDAHHGETIPTIDLARLLDPQAWQQEAAVLKYACEEWGFFQLQNHRIPETLLERVRNDMDYLFKTPLDEKNKIGDLQAFDEQALLAQKKDAPLDWSHRFYAETQPPQDSDTKAWPTTPVNVRESIELYSSEVMRVTRSLMEMIAKNPGVDVDRISDTYERQKLGMTYYPACPVAGDKILGFAPHSDLTTITLVWQLNPVQGLQIRRNGAWVPISPPNDALIVNVGDILEILTNGKYQSIEHRVTVNPHKGRTTISAFHYPRGHTSVSPLSEVVGGELAKYKAMTMDEILATAFASKPPGKQTTDYALLNN